MNKKVLLQSKMTPCGKDSARYGTWNLDKVTRRRAIKLNEQQVQRQQHLCQVLDRQKYNILSRAHRAMEELLERGTELEKEGKIRRMLIERNLVNNEVNRKAMEKMLKREKNMPNALCHNSLKSTEDHVWVSEMPKNSDQKFKINNQIDLKESQISLQRLQEMHVFEVSSNTGATQRWHLPVHSMFSRFVANLRTSHNAKKVTNDKLNK